MPDVEVNELGRPRWVDAKIMSYLPGLRKAAHRYYPREPKAAEDLVTDTIMHCLKNWQGYRDEEGGGFFGWISWAMRSQYSNKKKAAHRTLPIMDLGGDGFSSTARDESHSSGFNQGEGGASHFIERQAAGRTASNQEEIAIVNDVVRKLQTLPYGSDVLAMAMGESLEEIAARGVRLQGGGGRGKGNVSRQAVQQRIASTRALLAKMV
jgi:DNA-directed RNA polymerase specialized sigma24 family protein